MPRVVDVDGQVVELPNAVAVERIQAGKAAGLDGESYDAVDDAGNVVQLEGEAIGQLMKTGVYRPLSPRESADVDAKFARDQFFSSSDQKVQGVLEAGARGLTLGGSDVISRALGTDASELRSRQESAGVLGTAAEIAGSILPAIAAPGGAASLLRITPAGLSARAGAAVAKGGGVTRTAVAGGLEGALLGSGQYVSAVALEKAELSGESFVAAMGKGALLGGALGGGLAAGSKVFSGKLFDDVPLAKLVPKRLRGKGGDKIAKQELDEAAVRITGAADQLADDAALARPYAGAEELSSLDEAVSHLRVSARKVRQELLEAPTQPKVGPRVSNDPSGVPRDVAKSLDALYEKAFEATASPFKRAGFAVSRDRVDWRRLGVDDSLARLRESESLAKGAASADELASMRRAIEDIELAAGRRDLTPSELVLGPPAEFVESQIRAITELETGLQTVADRIKGPLREARRSSPVARAQGELFTADTDLILRQIEDARAASGKRPVFAQDKTGAPSTGAIDALTAAEMVDIAASIAGFSGLPGPGDLPLIGPLLSTYLRARGATRLAQGVVSRVPGTRAAKIAEKVADVQERIDGAASRIAQGAAKQRSAITRAATVLGSGIFGSAPKSKDPGAQLRHHVEELSRLEPEDVQRRVRSSFGLNNERVDSAMEQAALRKFAYLAEQAPEMPGELDPFASKWEPTTEQTMRFAEVASVLDDPLSLLDDLESGTLSLRKLEAVRQVYPGLLAEMQSTVLEKLSEAKKVPPYFVRESLSSFLGTPIGPGTGVEFALKMQQAYNAAEETPQPSPRQPRLGLSEGELDPATRRRAE